MHGNLWMKLILKNPGQKARELRPRTSGVSAVGQASWQREWRWVNNPVSNKHQIPVLPPILSSCAAANGRAPRQLKKNCAVWTQPKARRRWCFQACRALAGTDVAMVILWRMDHCWHRCGLTLPNGKCRLDATVICFEFICSHKEFKSQRGQKTCFDFIFISTGSPFDPIQSHQLLANSDLGINSPKVVVRWLAFRHSSVVNNSSFTVTEEKL